MSDHGELAVELAQLMDAPLGIDTILARIAELAVSALPECDAADIAVLSDGRLATRTATRNRAGSLDDAKYAGAGGPCVDSAHHQRVNHVDAIHAAAGFEPFRQAAARLGIVSTLTVPFATRDNQPLGAVSLYSMREQGFTDDDERMGILLADHVAHALADKS